jgi:hypothetical protein
MDKGMTFGGLGIGVVLRTVAGIFLAKKKKDIAKDLKSISSKIKTAVRGWVENPS